MKPCKLNKLFLFGLVVGAAMSSLFWQYQSKDTESSLNYKDFEIKNLQEQASTLRKDKQALLNPSPSPSLIPFVKIESLDKQNLYALSCYSPAEDKTIPTWLNPLKAKLVSEENLVNACLNETLNKIVFISVKNIDKGGFGRPGTSEFKFATFNTKDNQIEALTTSQGSYLGGSCGALKNWTKSNNIYYECGGGDGPWSTAQTYRLNLLTKQKGIIEDCYSVLNKTSCTNYCESSSDCTSGYACNLEKNNCVQSCKTDKDCVGNSCKPLGTITACVQ